MLFPSLLCAFSTYCVHRLLYFVCNWTATDTLFLIRNELISKSLGWWTRSGWRWSWVKRGRSKLSKRQSRSTHRSLRYARFLFFLLLSFLAVSRSSLVSVIVDVGTAPHLSMLDGCLSLSSLSPSIFFLSLLSLSSFSLLSRSFLYTLLVTFESAFSFCF